MSTLNSATGMNDSRLTWIEPTIIALDVADTAAQGGKGGDGGRAGAPDCNKS